MKLSLHLGLNVVNADHYGGWPGHLAGCVADCAALSTVLASAGFECAALLNECATRQAVVSTVTGLAARAQSGDAVIIHNSSHGGRRDNGVFGGWHETLCLYDGEMLDTEYRGLMALFAPGVRLLTMSDSCHSGGMDRGFRTLRARPAWLRPSIGPARGARNVEAGWVHLAACRADEAAGESFVPEVQSVHGALTWSLVSTLTALRAHSANVSAERLFQCAVEFASRSFPQQHPVAVLDGINPESTWAAALA